MVSPQVVVHEINSHPHGALLPNLKVSRSSADCNWVTVAGGPHRITRRTFIAVAGGTATVLALGPKVAGAQTTTRTVWRLDANWGYPRGPFGRTHAQSNASQQHAANKAFVSEAAALASLQSPCSMAVPCSFEVSEADYQELFSFSRDGGQSVDRRYNGVDSVWVRIEPAFDVCGITMQQLGPSAGAPSSSTGALAATGATDALVYLGLGLIAVGAGVFSRRNKQLATVEVKSEKRDS